MHLRIILIFALVLQLGTPLSQATIFGTVRGIVHDQQHRPIEGAQVALRARLSNWLQQAQTNSDGEFTIGAVPAGEYTVRIEHAGFRAIEQTITVASGNAPILHFPMELGVVQERVEVTANLAAINPESATTQSAVSRQEIEYTPGASRTNSLAMITDHVPGDYMVHDQLHIRGGHQVSWLVDGVPVPNTNIASNVGPQFHPKDIQTIEIQRGGYSAEYGDRTYGVFNVVTRSGFERNRQAELVTSYGKFNNTNDQISFGDHTERFAYYGSLSGYRTDLGLETPVPRIVNDQAAGLSGFGSIIFNKTPTDQLRLTTSVRGDHYQVPIDPASSNILNDVENER